MATVRPELVAGVGTLLEADPARVVALAFGLRGANRVVESTVEGMSMGQALPPGSRIRIELSNRTRYDTGEVVAFLTGGKVIVHRVVHRGRAGAAAGHVLTRGDATLVPDPPLHHVRVLGPITGVWRADGWRALRDAPRRAFRARSVARLVLWASIATLYVSPRVTVRGLTLLRRAERAVRFALARGSLRRPPTYEVR